MIFLELFAPRFPHGLSLQTIHLNPVFSVIPFVAGSGGFFIFSPARIFAQYPRGGTGTFNDLQTLCIATSDTPY
jgi:hypothetical protein